MLILAIGAVTKAKLLVLNIKKKIMKQQEASVSLTFR